MEGRGDGDLGIPASGLLTDDAGAPEVCFGHMVADEAGAEGRPAVFRDAGQGDRSAGEVCGAEAWEFERDGSSEGRDCGRLVVAEVAWEAGRRRKLW